MPPTRSSSSLRFRRIGQNVSIHEYTTYLHRLNSTVLGRNKPAAPSSQLSFSLARQDDELVATVTFPSSEAKRDAVKARSKLPPNNWLSDDVFDGLTVLYCAHNVEVDVCAIHGLGANAFDTWMASTNMWLRDFLPSSRAFQNSRIMTFGYDSTPGNSRSNDRVQEWAKELLEVLSLARSSTQERQRPCLFVSHSFGGLVAREAMLQLNSSASNFEGISLRNCGLLFLSTPHSTYVEAEWDDYLALTLESAVGLQRHAIIEQLRPFLSTSLYHLEAFSKMKIDPPYFCLVESERTKVAGRRCTIVSQESASIYSQTAEKIPGTDHYTICKFEGKYGGYSTILHRLGSLYSDVLSQGIKINRNMHNIPGLPSIVAPRYPAEKLKYFHSIGVQLPNTSRLVGRKKALDAIKSLIPFNKQPSKTVGLIGMGGIGKSEILMEAAIQNRGIRNVFTIRADNAVSLDRAFLDLANIVGHDLLNWQYPWQDVASIWRDLSPSERVQAFKDWLGTEENDRTLFIVDNIDSLAKDNAVESAMPPEARIVLYSSRIPGIVPEIRPAQEQLRVSGMDADEASQLLQVLLNQTRYLRQDPLADDALAPITTIVQGHPLATCRAVQYIDEVVSTTSESPIETFMAIMEGSNWKGRKEYLDYKPQASLSLMEVFEISLQQLQRYQNTPSRFLHVIGLLSDVSGTLDFRRFFSVNRPWLENFQVALPDLDLFYPRPADIQTYVGELEYASLAIISSETGVPTFHPIWMECIRQSMSPDERASWLRQILLLCEVSLSRGEDTAVLEPFKRNAVEIAERYDIALDRIVPSDIDLAAAFTPEPEIDPDLLDLQSEFSDLKDEFDEIHPGDEETLAMLLPKFRLLVKRLKNINDKFQMSGLDSHSSEVTIQLWDLTIHLFGTLGNRAGVSLGRNYKGRLLAMIEERKSPE